MSAASKPPERPCKLASERCIQSVRGAEWDCCRAARSTPHQVLVSKPVNSLLRAPPHASCRECGHATMQSAPPLPRAPWSDEAGQTAVARACVARRRRRCRRCWRCGAGRRRGEADPLAAPVELHVMLLQENVAEDPIRLQGADEAEQALTFGTLGNHVLEDEVFRLQGKLLAAEHESDSWQSPVAIHNVNAQTPLCCAHLGREHEDIP
mmetsp:Transcript_19846/g.59375  ORF Transcript_19846/g.59375 Transcript_19846/m.59375 type:complete len:209 (-) Transcript_19846:674-1300(-)